MAAEVGEVAGEAEAVVVEGVVGGEGKGVELVPSVPARRRSIRKVG